jgi:biofilm PGA synthesis protein PgaA
MPLTGHFRFKPDPLHDNCADRVEYTGVQKATRGTIGLLLTAACFTASAVEPAVGIESTYAEHTRGVELAREGRYDEGLAILRVLLERYPDDYPLQRDIILIDIWKGDCPDALKRFETVRGHSDLEPYLVVPVSDCLLTANRPKEAHRLTRLALQEHPGDEALRNAFLKTDVALRVDQNWDDERPGIEFDVHNDTSDQGLTEWVGRLEGSARIADGARLYARYRITRTTESTYRNGDLDRVGVGVRYRFDERLLLDQEVSSDLYSSGRGGASTRLVFEPRDAWRFLTLYNTYAEDIPLRARAIGIDARQWGIETSWEQRDYRVNWAASYNVYDFSDTNRRVAFYTAAGYAWEMHAQREQRLFIDWYHSSNSLDNAAYFNPSRDYSLGLTNRTDIVFDTRFQRHVDHFFLSAGLYEQEGFGTHPRWSVRYEQDYDLDASHALVIGTGLARNVYDGNYETDWRFYLRYNQRF